MKTLYTVPMLLCLVTSSCSKVEEPVVLTSAGEFYAYCSTDKGNRCGELLNHEGEKVWIEGYINVTFIESNPDQLILFEEETVNYSRSLGIAVVADHEAVYNKLIAATGTNNPNAFTRIRVRCTISGSDMWLVNEGCVRSPTLSTGSAGDIFIVD